METRKGLPMRFIQQILAHPTIFGVTLLGSIVVTCFLLLLLIAVAHGHEPTATAVRPAALGEQDRSLNYPLEYAGEESYTIVYQDVINPLDAFDCAGHNDGLRAKVSMIAEHIARRPDNGHIYENALRAIHNSWCTE